MTTVPPKDWKSPPPPSWWQPYARKPSYEKSIAELRAENERLRAQFPTGMQHCTILFKECEKGHGWLTATNWAQHKCQQCEIERLRAALRQAQSGGGI